MTRVEVETPARLRISKIELQGEQVRQFLQLVYIFALPPHVIHALYYFSQKGTSFSHADFVERSISQRRSDKSLAGLQIAASSPLKRGILRKLGLIDITTTTYPSLSRWHLTSKGDEYVTTQKVAAVREIARALPGIEGSTHTFGNDPRESIDTLSRTLRVFLEFISLKDTSLEALAFYQTYKTTLNKLAASGLLLDTRSVKTARRTANTYCLSEQGKKVKKVLTTLAQKLQNHHIALPDL